MYSNPPPNTPLSAEHLLGGRYRLGRKLGQGTGGVVYEGWDRHTDATVAIKILPAGHGNRAEFLVARALKHPFVVSTHDFGQVDDEHDFVVMDFVSGSPLSDWNVERAFEGRARVAFCAAFALAHLHTRGLSHADFKPDNLLVAETLEGPEARLIDFGMTALDGEGFKGTPAYAAPEIFQGQRPSPTTDVYALGVSLYEMFSGENPFAASTITETSERHRSVHPPAIEALSDQLNQLIARCMSKTVESRFADAGEVLFALTDALPEIAATFDAAAQLHPEAVPLSERAPLLEALVETLHGVSEGPIRISAPKGSGRTRVLDALYSQARLEGRRAIWLSGQDDRGLHISERIRQWIGPADPSASAQPPLARGSIGGLLAELGSQPTVLLIDDLDAMSAPDLSFINALASQMDPQQPLWMFYSTTPRGCREHPHLNRPGLTHRLTPLTTAGLSEALTSALGEVDRDGRLARLCHAATDGLPGGLWRIVQHQIEQGAIRWREGRWRVDDRLLLSEPEALCPPREALGDAPPLPSTLSKAARTAMEQLAIMGTQGPLKLRLATSTLSQTQQEALEALFEADLLTQQGPTLKITHPSHIDELIRALTPQRRLLLHQRAVRAYVKHDPNARVRLAHHVHAIGQRAVAFPLMEEAAAEAARKGRPQQAAAHHRWLILNGAPAAKHHEAAADYELRGGHYARARDHYREALHLGGCVIRLRSKIAWSFNEAGAYDEAIEEASAVLEAPEASPVTRFAALISVGWGLLMKGAYEDARGFTARARALLPALQPNPSWTPLCRLYRLEGTSAWHRGQNEEAEALFREGVELGQARREFEGTAECFMGLGTALLNQKRHAEAIEAHQEAIQRNEALGRLSYCAKSLNGIGITHYLRGELQAAEKAWDRFRDMCTRTKDLPDLVMAHNNLGFLHKDRGDLERAAAELERGRVVAEEAGFQKGLAMILGNLGEVRAAQGHLLEGRHYLEEALQLAEALSIEDEALEATRRLARIRLADGQPGQAIVEVDAALALARAAKSDSEIAQLTQIRGESQVALGDAATGAITLVGVLSQMGLRTLDGARAVLALSRATIESDEQLVPVLLVKAREIASTMGADAIIQAIDEQIQAHRQRRVNGRQESQLLEIARRLAESPSLDDMLASLAAHAVHLTGAQRGMVILYGREGGVELYPDPETRRKYGSHPDYSHTIADQVHATGQSRMGNDIYQSNPSDSVLAKEIQALVCVPLIAHGSTIGVVYVDSKEANLSLDESNREVLELLARQTAVNVNNVWLLEAAQQANEAKNHFLANVSHELRTPLNGILGQVEAVLDAEGLPAELRETLQTVMGCALGLSEQVNNLCDLSDLVKGSKEWHLNPTEFDLHTLLTRSIEVVRAGAPDHHLEVMQAVEPDIPRRVFADHARLRQILMQLLSNAWKFTPAGGSVKVYVTMAERRDGEALLRFAVRDTGAGIAAAAIPHLFQPFKRVNMGPTRAVGGSGMGLALAKQLAERMGGEIGVASVPNEGSTFWFTCLVKADVAPPTPPPLQPPPTGLRILLVEDNLLNQKVASRVLKLMGHVVLVAENGREGVRAFQENEFDVVLMDCQMPVMSGFDAARAIRALDGPGRDVPIIAVTANNTPEDREQCRLAGMNDFVPKPISRKQLCESIAKWYTEKGSAGR